MNSNLSHKLRETSRWPPTLELFSFKVSSQFSPAPVAPAQTLVQDRAWLEKVVSEGVRDDFKAMTEIYSRLCTYLDLAATNPPPPLHRGGQASGPTPTDQSSSPPAASGGLPATGTGTVNIRTGAATDFVPAHASAAQGTGIPPEAAPGTTPAAANGGGALSTFIAAAPSFSSSSAGLPETGSAAADGAGTGEGGGGGTAEGLATLEERVLNDLEVSETTSYFCRDTRPKSSLVAFEFG